jgi:hypothetical protein
MPDGRVNKGLEPTKVRLPALCVPAPGSRMIGVVRGRNAGYPAPPAQIPASGTTALGSCLGS